MATIKAFRGLSYNPDKIANLENVVAPPYDVISQTMQNYFYEVNPYNIIRLILGKESDGDNARNNKYTRAHFYLEGWIKKAILIKDKKPSVYVYRQTYLHEGKKRTRTGFLTLMKIEDPHKSGVLPHEYTLNKPKVDRLNLIKKVNANLSPIFSLYHDRKFTIPKLIRKSIKSVRPIAMLDFEGVRHQLWRISDKKTIARLIKLMKGKKVFIADGHHRYEVAFTYKRMMSKKRNADYIMVYFTNLSDTKNVTILSTHRLLKKIGTKKKADILKLLKGSFEVMKFSNLKSLMNSLSRDKKRPRFGIYMGNKKFYLVSLKKGISISMVIKGNKSSQWKKLDVTVLHNLIMKDLLDLKYSEENIKYLRDPLVACSLVDKGEYGIAFLLNPTKVHQVKEVAERGNMMPQKSTYFYPKLLTGLVINRF
ncbi:MAG: DUF1015 domain-containing protein [Candidatus Omnitrophica bacterium]|nr:DUF1015 domain-containing protein [Candidatus Omnitrophota bacterium]